MKPFYLGALFLACLQGFPTAYALNINTLPGGGLNNLPRRLDPIINPIEKTIEKTVEHTQQPIDNLVQADKHIDPLLELPERLPILNTEGNTAFVDVRVEQGWRAVEREWLVMLEDKDLPSFQALGIELIEQVSYEQLGISLLRFKVTAELDSLASLQQRLPSAMSASMDRNHIYASQNAFPSNSPAVRTSTPSPMGKREAACDTALAIGMIDTAVNSSHPAFTGDNKIISQHFLAENLATPDAHGTAIAGLFVGKSKELQPLLPNATVYSASVFFARNEHAQGATMMSLVRALDWLAGQNISVINMSLAGPDNQILAKVIEKILAKGRVIVAAAGNEGPATAPLFPAAYKGVIAVTAVDKEQKIYRWANQGGYISFAALGVAVMTASAAGGIGKESGTSMAAPVVTALMACELTQAKKSSAQALASLIVKAKDVGEPGRDPVFGYGVL